MESSSLPTTSRSGVPVPPTSGSGTSGAGCGGIALASGGVVPSRPPRSIVIDIDALSRGAAIQGYFHRLITDLMLPRFAPLLNIPTGIGGTLVQVLDDNILLYGAVTLEWEVFRTYITPTPTIFLLPLVVGFSGPNSNGVVAYAVPDPISWLDNGILVPMGVFVLSKRIAGEDVLIYGGTILPSESNAVPYYGLTDTEVGSEWVVPASLKVTDTTRLDLSELCVIIPSDNVKVSLIALLRESVPSLGVKVPGIFYPSSSENYYVHPDGIFAWTTYDYPRPSGRDEFESRFVIRNIRPYEFQYLMVEHNTITIKPSSFMERLIAVSLRSASEVPSFCAAKNGLYYSEVRHLRIMTDEVRQSRFLRGDWLGSFRLDHLSLFDFMPISHLGFDYNNSSHDTFTAFRFFIIFCTWVFGDEWSNSFMDDIAKWQTIAPWTEALPWVIHLSLEKAISSWVSACHQDASVFRYESLETSWGLLKYYLHSFMSVEKLVSMERSYDRSLSHVVVFPSPDCFVPLGIPSVRPNPKLGPPRSYPDGVPKTFVSTHSASSRSSLVRLPIASTKEIRQENTSLKRTLSVGSDKSDSKVAKAQTRFCHANIAYVFGFCMISNYEGPCKSPESPVSCGCGIHSTMDNLPSLAVVIRSFEEIRSKLSTFSEESLSDLRKHQI